VSVAALVFSACTSGGDTTPAQPPSSSTQRPAKYDAHQMCQAAAGSDETVVAAHLTTVSQVRTRRGGPRAPSGVSPAEELWAHLPDQAPAAWCAFHSRSRYLVAATAEDGRRVGFMITDTTFDPGTQGPAIP
jgi:hypothetical protein